MNRPQKLMPQPETGSEDPITFRRIRREDIPRVLEIERACFGQDAWAPNMLRFVLMQPRVVEQLVQQAGRIVGFMIYVPHRSHLRILNLAVCPACRRQGVAAAMIDRLKGKLSLYRLPRIVAEVRETNLPAQLLFRSQGFRVVRVLRDQYDDCDDDAYTFAFHDQLPPEGGEP